MRLFINELIRHYHIVFRCIVCDLVLEDMILKKKKVTEDMNKFLVNSKS